MKITLAVLTGALLATTGFVVAGCGGSRATLPASTITGPTTTTVQTPKTGALISCKNDRALVGAKTPQPGQSVTGSGDGPSPQATIQLTRRQDGSLVASCGP
jgi:hypothetical protein